MEWNTLDYRPYLEHQIWLEISVYEHIQVDIENEIPFTVKLHIIVLTLSNANNKIKQSTQNYKMFLSNMFDWFHHCQLSNVYTRRLSSQSYPDAWWIDGAFDIFKNTTKSNNYVLYDLKIPYLPTYFFQFINELLLTKLYHRKIEKWNYIFIIGI